MVAGDICIGADSHTCTYGALGAFSTGVGSTDMGAGMITGKAWFKVPSAIRFVLTGTMKPWVSGKDLILHIIGMIGVDGALYRSMEFVGKGVASLSMDDRFTIGQHGHLRQEPRTGSSRWMRSQKHIWKNIRRRNIRSMRQTRTPSMTRLLRLTLHR